MLLFISFACAQSVYSFGQVDCSTSNQLVCQFPVSATTLAKYQIGGTAAYQQAEKIANPINAAIATQLTQLPVPSATVGVVSLRQKGSEVGVPFDNLGPVLTDRPDTVGKGHVFMGFSFQHFNFNAMDGLDLGSFPTAFTYNASTPLCNTCAATVTGYANVTSNVGFKLDQYVGMVTIGLSRTTDISVIVPVSSVSIAVTSSNFTNYTYDSSTGIYNNATNPSLTPVSSTGSASGIGDVMVNFKQLVIGQEGSRAAAAAGATFRFPTGDSLNFLGSGALGGSAYGLFEYRARLAPHLKISYQWNDSSVLMSLGNTTGSGRLPGGLQYAGGADLKINRHLTLGADILGNQFVNAPTLSLSTVSFGPVPPTSSGVPATYSSETESPSTYTTANFSAGLKWSPIPHFLLYGNVMLQMNNVGLRSDPVPLFGIAYNFGKRK
jgi:hypothetical protein